MAIGSLEELLSLSYAELWREFQPCERTACPLSCGVDHAVFVSQCQDADCLSCGHPPSELRLCSWSDNCRYKGLAFWGLLIVLTRTLLPRLLVTAEEFGWIPARKHAAAAAAQADEDGAQRQKAIKKQS